jgi:hypothetical protein
VELHGVFVSVFVRGFYQHRNELSFPIKREIFFNYVGYNYYYHVNRILLCEFDWLFD